MPECSSGPLKNFSAKKKKNRCCQCDRKLNRSLDPGKVTGGRVVTVTEQGDGRVSQIWSLYLVRTRLDTLYTGIALDVERRFAEHSGTGNSGAKYLRSKGPLELVYQTEIGNRALTLQAEYRVKQLPRSGKEAIIARNPSGQELLADLGLGE